MTKIILKFVLQNSNMIQKKDFVEYATLHKFISTMQQIFTQCDFVRLINMD